jgi:hypothetical protein
VPIISVHSHKVGEATEQRGDRSNKLVGGDVQKPAQMNDDALVSTTRWQCDASSRFTYCSCRSAVMSSGRVPLRSFALTSRDLQNTPSCSHQGATSTARPSSQLPYLRFVKHLIALGRVPTRLLRLSWSPLHDTTAPRRQPPRAIQYTLVWLRSEHVTGQHVHDRAAACWVAFDAVVHSARRARFLERRRVQCTPARARHPTRAPQLLVQLTKVTGRQGRTAAFAR